MTLNVVMAVILRYSTEPLRRLPILIDDLKTQLLTHKYVDDTTVSEITSRGSVSEMLRTVDEVIQWSQANRMNINCTKTTEMVLSPLSK